MSNYALQRINELADRIDRIDTLETSLTNLSVRVFNSSNTAIPHNTLSLLTFDSERWDTNTMHDTSLNPSRLTVQKAGIYLISANIRWAANGTGTRRLSIKYNGGNYIGVTENGAKTAVSTKQSVTTIYNMAVGEYVQAEAFQTSGGNLNVIAAANFSPEFMMQRIP